MKLVTCQQIFFCNANIQTWRCYQSKENFDKNERRILNRVKIKRSTKLRESKKLRKIWKGSLGRYSNYSELDRFLDLGMSYFFSY